MKIGDGWAVGCVREERNPARSLETPQVVDALLPLTSGKMRCDPFQAVPSAISKSSEMSSSPAPGWMRDPAIDETERRTEIEVEIIEWGEVMYGWVEGVRLN